MQGFLSVSVDAPRRFQFDNEALLLGIRFLPGAIFALHRENIAPYLNRPIPSEEIFPKSDLFAEELFSAPTFEKCHELLIHFLQAHRLAENAKQNLLRYCTKRILRSHGQCSVAELAQATGYSARYIHDLCKKSVGNSPKLLGKIIRMQHTAALIRRQPQIPLSAIAAECGYADQSHMNRDFMQLIGCSPKQIQEGALPQNPAKITKFH